MGKDIITTDGAPAPVGPYSQAVKVDGWLYAAGQIPIDPASGDLVTGDIEAQARQVLSNLRAVVAAAGGSLADVVKTTIYLVDLDDFAAVNEIYAEFFSDAPPARACVQVAKLPKDVGIEVELVAKVA